MESEPDVNLMSDLFVNNAESPIKFAGNFRVRWIIQCNQPFNNFEHFPCNPMNEDLPIKMSMNGQELPFKIGNFLCYTIYNSQNSVNKILCSLKKVNEEFN
jgi:YT521-B-like domain